MRHSLKLIIPVALLTFSSTKISAYYTNMNASVVVGQTDFISSSSNQGGSAARNTLNYPDGMAEYNGKFIVSDNGNHRVLIFNSIPTTNNAGADVVIGQINLTNTSQNQGGSGGANTLNNPNGIGIAGNKLLVADTNNGRLLIYNSLPTANNASADVVIGQTNFTNTGSNRNGSPAADTLGNVSGLSYDPISGKLAVADYSNHRVLIYNSIPTINDSDADVVIGQANFTSNSANQGGSVAGNTLKNPWSVKYVNGKLFIADGGNHRVLVYNQTPISNNATADYVIGQQNLTSGSADQGGSAGANTIDGAEDVEWDGSRLYISDINNNRILVFSEIPTSNNASADMVIGQPNLTSTSENQGGSTAINSLYYPEFVLALSNNKIAVADSSSNRILIFDNITSTPSIGVSELNSIENNKIRLKGSVLLGDRSIYSIKSIQAGINGQGLSNVTHIDSALNDGQTSYRYDFYHDFEPWTNSTLTSSDWKNRDYQEMNTGYTILLRALGIHGDSKKMFYFKPFEMSKPKVIGNDLEFEFQVNKKYISTLFQNLDSYSLQYKQQNNSWQQVDTKIPVDFEQVKNLPSNLRVNDFLNKTTNGAGIYETNKIRIEYSNSSSNLKVRVKGLNLPSGKYLFHVNANDRYGSNQSSNQTELLISSSQLSFSKYWFPLQLNKASGTNISYISSFATPKTTMFTRNSNSINLDGIAFNNAKVTAIVSNLKTGKESTYTTTAINSKWLLPIKLDGSSQVLIYSELSDMYAALPVINIK